MPGLKNKVKVEVMCRSTPTGGQPVIINATLKDQLKEVFTAWAEQCQVQDIRDQFFFYTPPRYRGDNLLWVHPNQIINDYMSFNTRPKPSDVINFTLHADFRGIHLPTRLLLALHPDQQAASPIMIKALEELGPHIQSFAASTLTDISRFSLTSKAWSRREVMMPTTAIVNMLGMSKWLTTLASMEAAMTLFKNVVRPSLPHNLDITEIYQNTFDDCMMGMYTYEKVQINTIKINGITLLHVHSLWSTECAISSDALYKVNPGRQHDEICYLEHDESDTTKINLHAFLHLRNHLRSHLPNLGGIHDKTLLILLFYLLDLPCPMPRHEARDNELFSSLDRGYDAIESLPSYPSNDKSHDGSGGPLNDKKHHWSRRPCEDGTMKDQVLEGERGDMFDDPIHQVVSDKGIVLVATSFTAAFGFLEHKLNLVEAFATSHS